MSQDIISIVSLVIGVTSFVASIVFFIAGLKSEMRNKEILEKIETAIKGWQGKIMDTTLEAMESRPEIIGARAHQLETQSKQEFISNLSESIQKIVDNPSGGEEGKTQQENLKLLLGCYLDLMKSANPFIALQNSISPNINHSTQTGVRSTQSDQRQL